MYYLSRFVRIYRASPTATRSHSVQLCDPNHTHSYILYIPSLVPRLSPLRRVSGESLGMSLLYTMADAHLPVVDSDTETLDCLLSTGRHSPPSMMTMQMIVSERNFTTTEHIITVWKKHNSTIHQYVYMAQY